MKFSALQEKIYIELLLPIFNFRFY